MLRKPSSNKRPPLPINYTDENNTNLLQEIQALSRALSLPLQSNLNPNPNSNSNSNTKTTTIPSTSSQKKNPSSFWNWKPFKSLSHIGHRRYNCLFSLHIHSIQNLPAAFDNAAFSVHWKRASDPPSSAAGTSPSHAFHGAAEFDETLTHRCSIYGTRKRYESKQFVIYVSVHNAASLDFGKQVVDVTRLLPVRVEDDENSSGKWSTSFRLSGPGKGACLNVSFGYSLIGDDFGKLSDERFVGKGLNRSQSVDDVRELHEVLLLPSSKSDVDSLSDTVEKMEIGNNCEIIEEICDFCEEEDDEVIKPKCKPLIEHFEGKPGFVTSDQDVENSVVEVENQPSPSIFEKIDFKNVSEKLEESRLAHEADLPEIIDEEFKFDVVPNIEPEVWPAVQSNLDSVEFGFRSDTDPESPRERLWKQFEGKPGLVKTDQDVENSVVVENQPSPYMFEKVDFKNVSEQEEKSRLPHETDLPEIIDEEFEFDVVPIIKFETMAPNLASTELGFRSDTDPESPRERLWKQFEEEALCAGGALLLFSSENDSDEFDLSDLVHEAETELLNSAKLLEEAESEALMREWGINEKAFHSNDITECQTESELSPLGEGLGPFVRTRDGGFLRSMRASLFGKSKSNGCLIMQVSSPVVVPAEMGHGVMEILGRLASVGIEKLSKQAKSLMPLEDVAGKTMQQIAWEANAALGGEGFKFNRETDASMSQNVSLRKKEENLTAFDRVSEYVSVEDLAPLAMDKIEALCIDGLRIQSGMSDDSLINLEGAAGLQLLDDKGNADNADGLMSLSITLDEWLRLDSGILNEEDRNSDRTSRILAAHRGQTEGKRSGERWGLLGSNFTAALMVQLRDPLRNFDPVGTPMLALVQVERVFVPPKPKIFAIVSETVKCEEDDEPEKMVNTKKDEEEETCQFMITKVHVAGLRTEPNEKRIWGNPTQQQSGSRWLVANGMGKSIKHPFMKSKASPVTSTAQKGNALWSISSLFFGVGSKRKEMPAVNPHVRNPNINFPERR